MKLDYGSQIRYQIFCRAQFTEVRCSGFNLDLFNLSLSNIVILILFVLNNTASNQKRRIIFFMFYNIFVVYDAMLNFFAAYCTFYEKRCYSELIEDKE